MLQHELAVRLFEVAGLRTYHRNPRRGNVERIKQSLTVNGQYKPVVVNRGTHTGRPDEVLAGNHTLIAARDLAWAQIAGVTVDVDEDQAARIVAADNRTSDLGEYDDRLLAELLAELPDLDGTGYDPGDVDEILARVVAEAGDAVGDPAGEWAGMPDYEQNDLSGAFRVAVHFATDEDADAFFKLIDRPRKPSMWWPEDDGHKGSSWLGHDEYVARD